jgi:DNA-binding CsgD family transcriptional regulator
MDALPVMDVSVGPLTPLAAGSGIADNIHSRQLRPDAHNLSQAESSDDDDEALTRAAQMTGLLRDLVPFTAIHLTAWDPTSGSHHHRTLASDDFSDEILGHINDEFVKANPAFQRIRAQETLRAMRWRDMARDWDIRFDKTFTGEEIMIPGGFKEGISLGLWLPGGHYTGSLNIGWDSVAGPTDERLELIERFRSLAADICDTLRAPRILANALAPDAFTLLVAANRVVAELPGRLTGPQLSEGGELRAFLAQRWGALSPRRFLWIDGSGVWHRVELIPCRSRATIVAERQVVPPSGITPRELEVLHLVSTGASNSQIAKRLFVSARTVSTHVEHLLAKLGCASRAQLAAVAVAEGLLLAEAPPVKRAGPRL